MEEKRRRLEESEKKRQAMMQAMKEQASKKGPNFTIQKKDLAGNLTSAQLERNKTKEQLEEEKKISLSIRIKPLEIENFSIDKLRYKATELWEAIVKLETEKYDLEERQKRQDYDVSFCLVAFFQLNFLIDFGFCAVERVEGKAKATAQAQGIEEGS